MKLLKPSWVHHDEKPIFSVDVHQECLKFATGGQGLDSGRVVIWNLLPVLSEKAEQDNNIPKMLCQMDNHLACVNCVRWSQNGQTLASASDDKLVMIWRKSTGSSGVFGTGGLQKNPESWRCIATLRGHCGDVLDLAWSPHDRWLASCSIDNNVIVWDAQAFPNLKAILRGHKGLVKGVAWDPVGKFLASQSDDRSVKIWNTADWSCSNTITEPFEECGGTTHILRLSWSPDGQYLVSAHAMNGGGPTAQIIEREGWKCDKDFVGHRKAVTCVRFHNAVLKRNTPLTNKAQQYCCLAVGSRDRSLSVWMTVLQRPLVVIHELFNDSILDLSWGPDKCLLMACSGDGTLACLQFDDQELGIPVSEEEKKSLYQKVYGEAATIENGKNNDKNLELLDSADKLKPPNLLMDKSNNNCQAIPSGFSNGFSGASIHQVNSHCLSQITPFGSQVTQSDIVGASSTYSAPVKAINRQTEVRMADGKRRITPVFIPLNQDVSNSSSPLSSSSRPITTPSVTPSTIAGSNVSSDTETAGTSEKSIITPAEDALLDSRLTRSAKAKIQSQLSDLNAMKSLGISSIKTIETSTLITATTPSFGNNNQTQKVTITPTTKNEFSKVEQNHRILVQNGHVQIAGGSLLCRVTAWSLSPKEMLWELFVGSPIVNVNLCSKNVILCSLDGTLRILSTEIGSAMLPIISFPTITLQSAFCPNGKYVGVITECGLLRIWDIENARAILALACSEILGKHDAILQFNITEHGIPLVILSNGNAYTYSLQLQSWLVLNTNDPIFRHGLMATIPKEFNKNFQAYPLLSIQGSISNSSSSIDNITTSGDVSYEWQSVANIHFIENQIKLCEVIKSEDELKHWYAMLTYQLSVSGDERRLRMLLNDILGIHSVKCISSEELKKRKVLSTTKLCIFESALDILKVQTKWQRLCVEYKTLYSSIEKKSSLPVTCPSLNSISIVEENPTDDKDQSELN